MDIQNEDQLITIKQASEQFSKPYGTISHWVAVGHLKEKGREHFHSPGGGKILVRVSEVAHLINNPPPIGRPKKRRQKRNGRQS